MMQPEPLVSIIIPTRNRKGLLYDAVRSAVAQTHSNLQVVVQDNNSTDGSPEHITGAIHDSRLEYSRSPRDLSMTDNWNQAFQQAHGDYFVRLDDDNVLGPDFIECALREIEKNNYDFFIYSPLIVNLGNQISTLFAPDSAVHTLTPRQEAYLEYFNLIDSNYVLYKTATVMKVFPDRSIYKTTLPDRHMNYRLMNDLPHIRAGISAEVKGLTRFDYRPPLPADYHLTYVDYDRIEIEEILKLPDCTNNFHMHRIATLAFFLAHDPEPRIKDFFDRKIINPAFYRTVMKLGHLYMGREAFTWKEWGIYNRLVLEIIADFLAHPAAKLEKRSLAVNMAALIHHACRGNIRSFLNILARRARQPRAANKALGDKLVHILLAGENVTPRSQYAEYGSLAKLLDAIDRL